ncbi:MAG: CRISPR-associated endonuclease Cas1 [Lentisphaeria bacterium]|nr:CRISPR-associated endonuclease Cas1 [Lentisphaeria bacterium]
MGFQEAELVTADMVAQYAYCPRRMYLMYVDGKWDDNYFTEHGKAVHRRTDSIEDDLPCPLNTTTSSDDEPEPIIARSVLLSDEQLGIIAKPDLIEADGQIATPVEMKRGSIPNTPTHTYEPERVQLMVQALLLRAHGFQCTTGIVYYASSRKRVEIPLDDDLESRTLNIIAQIKEMLLNRPQLPPPPLNDSPKCNGCSLAGICLPDETNALLAERSQTEKEDSECQEDNDIPDVRRLFPARPDAVPLYIQTQGAKLGKSGETLVVEKSGEKLGTFPLKDVSQVVLCGNVFISAQCVQTLCARGIPIIYLSPGHWYYGITIGEGLKNAYDREAQFKIAADPLRSLEFAKAFASAKAQNQRTLLRRNALSLPDIVLKQMQELIRSMQQVTAYESLLGLEGSVARLYFENFTQMLKNKNSLGEFHLDGRNRRPPMDPLNALLSFGYSLLVKETTVSLIGEGLDPWWGLYHRPKHGKPALALDLMEEFRPVIVDSAIITLINNEQISPNDFLVSTSGCSLKDTARKKLIAAFEQRLDQMITHPIFDYRCSWRVIIRLQCKLLCKALRGEIASYQGMTTR